MIGTKQASLPVRIHVQIWRVNSLPNVNLKLVYLVKHKFFVSQDYIPGWKGRITRGQVEASFYFLFSHEKGQLDPSILSLRDCVATATVTVTILIIAVASPKLACSCGLGL